MVEYRQRDCTLRSRKPRTRPASTDARSSSRIPADLIAVPIGRTLTSCTTALCSRAAFFSGLSMAYAPSSASFLASAPVTAGIAASVASQALCRESGSEHMPYARRLPSSPSKPSSQSYPNWAACLRLLLSSARASCRFLHLSGAVSAGALRAAGGWAAGAAAAGARASCATGALEAAMCASTPAAPAPVAAARGRGRPAAAAGCFAGCGGARAGAWPRACSGARTGVRHSAMFCISRRAAWRGSAWVACIEKNLLWRTGGSGPGFPP